MGEKQPPLPCVIHSRMRAGGVETGSQNGDRMYACANFSWGLWSPFLPDALLEDLLTDYCTCCLETNVQAEYLQGDHHRSGCHFHSSQEPMPCAWKILPHVVPLPPLPSLAHRHRDGVSSTPVSLLHSGYLSVGV